MEAKLAAYRADKQKEQSLLTKFSPTKLFLRQQKEGPLSSEENISNDSRKHTERQLGKIDTVHDAENKKTHSWLTYLNLCLKIILWLLLWAYFIHVEFGSVFFVLSLFFFLYKGTRTGPIEKKLSAYSVFNPNFETLEGTFTAEQFEKELKYGAGSVR
ncbi:hypothetical protein ACJMK2_035896 [Sinanodonta woodiana]|uniref:SAYSvFN domain-containing protein n=1 Tax=Sinanodonta woodiana TaxID=1069815 RepID=A0ABD3WGJ0_SINWO